MKTHSGEEWRQNLETPSTRTSISSARVRLANKWDSVWLWNKLTAFKKRIQVDRNASRTTSQAVSSCNNSPARTIDGVHRRCFELNATLESERSHASGVGARRKECWVVDRALMKDNPRSQNLYLRCEEDRSESLKCSLKGGYQIDRHGILWTSQRPCRCGCSNTKNDESRSKNGFPNTRLCSIFSGCSEGSYHKSISE